MGNKYKCTLTAPDGKQISSSKHSHQSSACEDLYNSSVSYIEGLGGQHLVGYYRGDGVCPMYTVKSTCGTNSFTKTTDADPLFDVLTVKCKQS